MTHERLSMKAGVLHTSLVIASWYAGDQRRQA
jgi:hypothetical protein